MQLSVVCALSSGMSVRELSQKPKELVSKESIAKGEIDISHLSPGLFSQIKLISSHGHEGISSKKITAESIEVSNLIAKAQFDYQDDSNDKITNTVNKSGLRIQYGWAQTVGSGSNSTSFAVTFPNAFSQLPMVLVCMAGAKANTVGASLGDFSLESACHAQSEDVTVTGFSIRMNRQDDEDTMSSSSYFAATWIAIGVV